MRVRENKIIRKSNNSCLEKRKYKVSWIDMNKYKEDFRKSSEEGSIFSQKLNQAVFFRGDCLLSCLKRP
jgi:translation initiation factor RLI1